MNSSEMSSHDFSVLDSVALVGENFPNKQFIDCPFHIFPSEVVRIPPRCQIQDTKVEIQQGKKDIFLLQHWVWHPRIQTPFLALELHLSLLHLPIHNRKARTTPVPNFHSLWYRLWALWSKDQAHGMVCRVPTIEELRVGGCRNDLIQNKKWQ